MLSTFANNHLTDQRNSVVHYFHLMLQCNYHTNDKHDELPLLKKRTTTISQLPHLPRKAFLTLHNTMTN